MKSLISLIDHSLDRIKRMIYICCFFTGLSIQPQSLLKEFQFYLFKCYLCDTRAFHMSNRINERKIMQRVCYQRPSSCVMQLKLKQLLTLLLGYVLEYSNLPYIYEIQWLLLEHNRKTRENIKVIIYNNFWMY